MVTEIKKIRAFEHMGPWREAHEMAVSIFEATKIFYKSADQAGLASSLRSAALSVTLRLARAFAEETYEKKINHFAGASGDLIRIQNELIIARDLEYMYASDFEDIAKQWLKVEKTVKDLLGKSKPVRKV